MTHIVSNIIRPRLAATVFKNIVVARPHAVVWELENIANRYDDNPVDARLALRDIALMQSATCYIAIPQDAHDFEHNLWVPP